MRSLGPGDEFAGFTIEAIAGRGGMGIVYRARQKRPSRVVALKVIAPELAADAAFRARFERESSAAARIEHPNVIPVYAVDEEAGVPYIAMRFIDGDDLGALLTREGRRSPMRGARLIAQVADALDAAHARGLVHRDVKPANVLIAAGEHVYLTDFGLAKLSADSTGISRTGLIVGTVDYMAPEQARGDRIDARADIYALGCVAYELLSGSVPFPRGSDMAKLYAHVNDPRPRLEGVPAPLADAVARAMATNPDDRFLSAGDFGRAVERGAHGAVDASRGRTVATGRAAIGEQALDAPATEVASAAGALPTEVGTIAGAERDAGDRGGSPPRIRRSVLAGLIAAVVLGAGAAVAILAAGSSPGPSGGAGASHPRQTPATHKGPAATGASGATGTTTGTASGTGSTTGTTTSPLQSGTGTVAIPSGPIYFSGVVSHAAMRPSTLQLTVDGTLAVVGVTWTSWGAATATGSGTAEYHGCNPSCGQAPTHTAPVAIALSGVTSCSDGRNYYGNVQLTLPSGRLLDRSFLRSASFAPCA